LDLIGDIMTPDHTKLNLGCGFKKLNDHWNVDIEAKCNPDQVWDLEQFPWPWEDSFFDRLNADNILEHLGQDPKVFTKVMQEMYRISKDGAEWYINIPHHRSDTYFDDYTHVRMLTPKTFALFDQAGNVDSIKRKYSDSAFGILHDIDIEIVDVNYEIVQYWKDLQSEGMLANRQLNINMNTMCNVAQSVTIFLKVHKPGRFANYLKAPTLY
jgi:hypothetical protein